MLETPHVFLGAAIASKIPNPFISIPLSFASHFILEKVPHWNPHLNTETQKYGYPTRKSIIITTADSTFALLSGSFIAYQALPNQALSLTILASCLASILPDLIEAPYFFLRIRNKYIARWIDFQKSLQVDTTPVWGALTQVAVIIAAIFWIRS
jgi:hypothetical protein